MSAPIPESMMSAISVLDSLIRAGMRHVVVAPGSRSAPLAYALAVLDRAGIVDTHVRIDERSAGFLALGLAKASSTPVAVVTTSGTAVGNLLPAVMEASHAGVPLVVISADRPLSLRGAGANQTTAQPGIFSHFVRAEADLTDYHEGSAEMTGRLAACLDAAFGRDPQNWNVRGEQAPGPVHINLAFDFPLTPDVQSLPLMTRWAESLKEPADKVQLAPADLGADSWIQSGELPSKCSKTIVVAGDGAGPVAQQFAQNLGLPLLAEPSSNARFSMNAIPGYTEVLRTSLGEEVENVVVFGHPTLSRPVHAVIQSKETRTFFYEPVAAAWHEDNRLPGVSVRSLDSLARTVGHGFDVVTRDGTPWLQAWQNAGQTAWTAAFEDIAAYRATGEFSGRTAGRSLALQVWEDVLKTGETLVVGSSNLIRDLDYIIPVLPSSPRVFANRGLAGIDGTIATASGISLATGGRGEKEPAPVRLLCGDLTFLHDAGSLNVGPLEVAPRLSIDVLHDNGGGIFSILEHGQLGQTPEFEKIVERFFTTPHSVDLEELAQSYRACGISVRIHRIAE